LVEGYFDQLALYRADFPQVVATCGTALTADHARLLKRYVQRVQLLFDQDAAGKQATFKAMAALQEEGVPASVIELPAGEDPDSFVQRQGAEAFQQRLAQARPAMDLFMEDALAVAGPAVEERVRAAEIVLERISGLTSELEQDLYLKDLAGRSGIDLQLLKQKLVVVGQRPARMRVDSQSGLSEPPEYPLPPELDGRSPPEVIPEKAGPEPLVWSKAERLLLEAALLLPEKRQSLGNVDDLFQSPEARKFALEIVASEKELDDESLLDDFSATYHETVKQYIRSPKDKVEGIFDSLLGAVKKEALQKECDKVFEQLKAAYSSGDIELQENLTRKFTQLKKQLKLL